MRRYLPVLNADDAADVVDAVSVDLESRLRKAGLPGLKAAADLQRFVTEIERGARRVAAARRIAREPGRDVRQPPFADGWSPLPVIVQWSRLGDFDEAAWLAYLTTFFGPDERRGRETWYATRLLYG